MMPKLDFKNERAEFQILAPFLLKNEFQTLYTNKIDQNKYTTAHYIYVYIVYIYCESDKWQK